MGETEQGLFGHVDVSSQTQAEMLRHLEKAARHEAGVVTGSEKVKELVDTAGAEARKDGGAEGREKEVQIGARVKEAPQGLPISREQRAGTGAGMTEMIEGDHADQFGGMHRR